MFYLTPRVSPPMGKSQNPGVGRPLLVSPMEGRDARAWVSPNLRNQVLSLAGGRRSSSGERHGVSLVGGDARAGASLNLREKSSLPRRERQRGSSDAESLSSRESRPAIDPSTQGDSGLVASRLDAYRSARHPQDALLQRRLAPPTRAISPTCATASRPCST